MREIDKLRVLLPHWIEHNGEHAAEFRDWAERAGPAQDALLRAAGSLEEANEVLRNLLEALGGALELDAEHGHGHHHS
jgi:hypothetical protein